MANPREVRWYKGTVKAVPSGDTLVIMANTKKENELPPEKSITLACLMAPKLARRDAVDEPFAWDSREYLRKKCIGKEATFKVDYTVPTLLNREFGTVFVEEVNLALAVVGAGWARVRHGNDKTSDLEELLKAEEQAKQKGIGIWNTKGSEVSIRSIPPSAVGENSTFDAREFLETRKGQLLQALVEQVRDGSSFRVYLLPSFLFVQVHLAGVQAPSMSRRAPAGTATDGPENGEAKQDNGAVPDPWAKEAKHFTEVRVLHREVRILLEGTDKFNTLFGTVSYLEGDKPVNLALELLKQGLAKYAEWSANMLPEDEKKQLKAADLQAKKAKLRIYTGIDTTSNTKPLKDDTFTGKVIDIMNADCLIIADDAVPPGKPGAERRVSLSSIQAPRRAPNDEGRFREAKEFLRTRIIGQQVRVFMEYSRTVQQQSDKESRVLDFGSVFLVSAPKGEVFERPLPGQPEGCNVAEMVVANGYAQVVRHRDFDDRSHYYDNLLAAEKRASSAKKSSSAGRGTHINDLTAPETGHKRARHTLSFLQKRRLPAVVEVVFSGHRYKLFVPKETCVLFFTLSGVRCPGRNEPYSDEALSFMRRRILQRDVEIEVETLDKTGSFLGSLYEGKVNVAIALLEAGLARLQTGFADRLPDSQALIRAEEQAKKQRLKIWENFQESPADSAAPKEMNSKQEVLEVVITEVLDGGRFYVQVAADARISSIQKQLESLKLKEKLPPVNFSPKRGDSVLAQFSMDDSWYRALVVDTPKSGKEGYEVFYVDYGNQEEVPLSRLRPADAAHVQGLAQLCSLAYVKVPTLQEDCGEEAAEFLSNAVANKKMMARVEARDGTGGKVRDQGSGPRLIVTLMDVDKSKSVNAAMLEAGLARLEKAKKWDSKEKVAALEALEEYQAQPRKNRENIWRYGDFDDEEDEAFPAYRGGGRGRK